MGNRPGSLPDAQKGQGLSRGRVIGINCERLPVLFDGARHIAGRTHSPLADLPPDDEQLARTVADLVARAGRAKRVTEDQLVHARLVLERARLERAIRRARADGAPGIGELARQREEVMERIRQTVARLERAI